MNPLLRHFVVLILCFCAQAARGEPRTQMNATGALDELLANWSFYKYTFTDDGRVMDPERSRITTSEGQSYAMLRALWTNDKEGFAQYWTWTKEHLQRTDGLFSWKWDEHVIDDNTATDADVDIALALLLAGRQFANPSYEQ